MRLLDPTRAEVVSADTYTKHILLQAADLAAEGTRVQIVTIAAGDTVADHYHRHTREFYYVLQGRCHLLVNEQELTLTVGDMLLMEPDDVHRLTNPGPEPFRVLVFKTNADDDTYWP
jgi:putative monooxygenase